MSSGGAAVPVCGPQDTFHCFGTGTSNCEQLHFLISSINTLMIPLRHQYLKSSPNEYCTSQIYRYASHVTPLRFVTLATISYHRTYGVSVSAHADPVCVTKYQSTSFPESFSSLHSSKIRTTESVDRSDVSISRCRWYLLQTPRNAV